VVAAAGQSRVALKTSVGWQLSSSVLCIMGQRAEFGGANLSDLAG
jgi:hypothetical protein